MKLFQAFFIFLLLVLGLIFLMYAFPIPQGSTGIPHGDIPTMLKGTNAVTQHSSSKYLSFFFGVGILGILTFCLLIGARKSNVGRKIQYTVLAMIAVYFAGYVLMCQSYWSYSLGNNDQFWGGFPIPTAFMLYWLWGCPLILTSVYIWKFDEWVISPDEIKEFKTIVEQRNKKS